MTEPSTHPYMLALIQQQEYIGLVGLGKLADPLTGQAELDLDKTRMAINLLEMLEQKTAGNVSAEERQALRQVLTSLRLNYVEERQKKQAASVAQEPQAQPASPVSAKSEADEADDQPEAGAAAEPPPGEPEEPTDA